MNYNINDFVYHLKVHKYEVKLRMIDDNLREIICNRIIALRKKHNLTQEQLAYQSGIAKGGLSEIERCMKTPTILTIIKICSCLGITMKEFFDFSEIDDLVNII